MGIPEGEDSMAQRKHPREGNHVGVEEAEGTRERGEGEAADTAVPLEGLSLVSPGAQTRS